MLNTFLLRGYQNYLIDCPILRTLSHTLNFSIGMRKIITDPYKIFDLYISLRPAFVLLQTIEKDRLPDKVIQAAGMI
jgi:hypothetical protein